MKHGEKLIYRGVVIRKEYDTTRLRVRLPETPIPTYFYRIERAQEYIDYRLKFNNQGGKNDK